MSSVPTSKGQIGAEITKAIIQLETEHLGRGSQWARTQIIQDKE